MARRIEIDYSEPEERFIGDPGGQGFTGGGDFVDRSSPIYEPPPPDPGGGMEVSYDEGNTERGRDLRPDDTPTTTPQAPPYEPPAYQPAPAPEPPPEIPQGVSVGDALTQQPATGGEFFGGGTASQDVPAMPDAPAPISAQAPDPGYAQEGTQEPVAPVGAGPRRRTVVDPQIFGESKSPLLFGRSGGLMGGGLGATGAGEASGPIAPTQMMKHLLQLFQRQ